MRSGGNIKPVKLAPTLLIMGDHEIGFHVEDWYPLIGDLESTQVIVQVMHLIISTLILLQIISLASSMDGSNITSFYPLLNLKK
jgi:hypothetical protein